MSNPDKANEIAENDRINDEQFNDPDKKAVLVTYSITTRIIVGRDDPDMTIIQLSNNKLLCNPSAYIIGTNVVEIEDDEECPYDHNKD